MTDASPPDERGADVFETAAAIRSGDLARLQRALDRRADLIEGDEAHGPLIEVAVAADQADARGADVVRLKPDTTGGG